MGTGVLNKDWRTGSGATRELFGKFRDKFGLMPYRLPGLRLLVYLECRPCGVWRNMSRTSPNAARGGRPESDTACLRGKLRRRASVNPALGE
jgi:hypothetical protein